jgi:hypothetical protein
MIGSLGKNRSTTIFGTEHPTKDNLSLWGQEFIKIHTPTFKLLSPLDIWLHPLVCVWRHYFDKDKDKVRAKSDRGTETYTKVDGPGRRYRYSHREAEVKISGHPATAVEQEDGTLKVQEVGHD